MYNSVTASGVTWGPSLLSFSVMLLRVWYTSWRVGRWLPTFSELAGLLSVVWLLAANIFGSWLIAQELKYNVQGGGLSGYITLALAHPDIMRNYFKAAFVNTVSYYCLAWLFKAMFLSCFFTLQRHFTKPLQIMFFFTVSYNICAFLTTIVALFSWCHPLSRAWANPITGQWCNFQAPHFILIGLICNVTSDLLIFTFAIWLVETLSVRRGEYCAIVFVVLLGCMSIAACVIRFSFIWALSAPGGPNAEITLEHASIVWTEVELATGQIAACLPSFRAVVRTWLQARKTSPWSWRLPTAARKPHTIGIDTELGMADLDSGIVFCSMAQSAPDSTTGSSA